MYRVLNDCSKVLTMRVARVVLCMQEALGLEFRGSRVPSLMAWARYMWVCRAVSVSSCILKFQFPEGKMDGRMEGRKKEKRKEGRGEEGKKEEHFFRLLRFYQAEAAIMSTLFWKVSGTKEQATGARGEAAAAVTRAEPWPPDNFYEAVWCCVCFTWADLNVSSIIKHRN